MKTCMKSKSLSACRSSAVAVTLLALLIGGSRAVRADDVASLSVPVQDTLLMPLEDLKALERRLAYLEGAVAALTEASQHINAHQLCVSDDSGAETCVTKTQLDALLVSQVHGMEAARPSAIVDDANKAPAVEAASVGSSAENSRPLPAAALNEATQRDKDQGSEEAETIAATSSDAEKRPAPDSVPSPVQSIDTAEDTEAGSKIVRAELSRDRQAVQPSAEISPSATELNVIPEHENPAGGDLP
jgi:hypothetical protein